MLTRDNRFIKREYRKALFPIMFSVLGGTLNTFIDSCFVSQSMGADAMAAINLCLPIFLILCMFGSLFSNGASAVSAQEIGKEKLEESKYIYYSALIWCVLVGVVIMMSTPFVISPLCDFMAKDGQLRSLVYDYALVTMLGCIPTMMVYMPIRYLQLDGKPKQISIMMAIMIVIDIVLDYLFLFVLSWGMTGAALASVISTFIATVYGFIYLQKGELFNFQIKKLKICHTVDIIKFGAQSSLGNLWDSIKMFFLNSLVLSTLGAPGAAIWAVLNSLSEMSLSISLGVPQAAVAMVGVYYPARENASIKQIMNIQIAWGLVLSMGYGFLLVALKEPIAMLFKVDQDLFMPLICLGVALLFDTFVNIWIKYMNAIGFIGFAGILNLLRKVVLPVGVAYNIVNWNMYFWAFLPFANILVVLIGGAMLYLILLRSKRSSKPLSTVLLLDEELEREDKILDFSIHLTDDEICDAAERISGFCEIHKMDIKVLTKISLAIEELMVVLKNHYKEDMVADMRAFVTDDETGLQIRIAGDKYDVFEAARAEDADPVEFMGVTMMEKLATMTNHYYALGINTLHIFFNR